MPEVAEQSLSEKMTTAYNLAFDLWKIDEAGGYKILKQGQEADLVYGWADGLCHKYYEKISSGHCSPQAMIDFDVAKFEESVDQDIKKMEKMLKKLKPQKENANA